MSGAKAKRLPIAYGRPPENLGEFNPATGEMMLYQYLPVKLRSMNLIAAHMPPRLHPFFDMVWLACQDAKGVVGAREFYADFHVYLTAKTLWVEPGSPGNRPGWHADGYGSFGDLNYIWSDMNPTEFAIMPFQDIPEDDFASMQAMEDQIALDPDCIWTPPNKQLLRLDEGVVHRVNPKPKAGYRSFVKISVSRHRFNLKGNSKNHLIDYSWAMHDRTELRNLDNKDFVK